ncbi:uncharacterized protein LOC112539118 [Tetranychus urticae]|uniref:uncharacterized protein LOC112539118 n=1 Tax=Tetranychus urticae TaxID=32264 RepID=UPI000D654593|nr:uncharacterized protein LOC112539118 [Tetranychus urticae]
MFRSIILLACLASNFASDVEYKSEFNQSEVILNAVNYTDGNNDIKLLNVSTVLVTGANRGIGLEFIRQLALLEPKISHIIATCRDPDTAEELKSSQSQQ